MKRTGISEEMYAKKLICFKENERPEAVLLMANNHQLMRMLVTWPNVAVKPACTTEATDSSDEEVWNWLWENTAYNPKEWSSKSGVSSSFFEESRAILIGNRLVYPDGTLNKFVERYLREKVLGLFDAKSKVKKT